LVDKPPPDSPVDEFDLTATVIPEPPAPQFGPATPTDGKKSQTVVEVIARIEAVPAFGGADAAKRLSFLRAAVHSVLED
jgi:hypothetical protein